MNRKSPDFSLALALLLLFTFGADYANAGVRRAFVVGIDQYDNFSADRQLANARSDATAVAQKLTQVNFTEVTTSENPSRYEFNTAWQSFLDTIETGDTVAFFFSGHGVAIDGKNYLLPRSMPDLQPGRSELLKSESLSLNNLMLDIQKRNPAVTLMILDACRNDPFSTSSNLRDVSSSGGLAGSNDPPSGTFIMYSAAAGMVALDSVPGADYPHSVYTQHLLDLIPRKDLNIATMARELRQRVNDTTKTMADGFLQSPAYYDGLVGDFCLPGCGDVDPASTQQRGLSETNAQPNTRNDSGDTSDTDSPTLRQSTNTQAVDELQVAAVDKQQITTSVNTDIELVDVSKKDRRAASTARKKGKSFYWKDLEKSLSSYRRATVLDPNNEEGWVQLGNLHDRKNELQRAMVAYQRALTLAQTKASDEWMAISFGRIASVYQTQGEFEKAETFYAQALEREQDKERIAHIYSRLGSLYMVRGGYIEAENYYLQSLELFQELKIKEDIAGQYGRLGVVYRQYGDLDKSEEYHLRALKIQKKLKRKSRVAGQYAGLALLYRDRGDAEKSEEHHRKAIDMFEKLEDKASVAGQLGYLGTLYMNRGDLDQAEQLHLQSKEKFESLGYKGDVAYQYGNLSYVYKLRENYDTSEQYLRSAIELYEELGRKDGVAEAYGHIGELKRLRGDLDAAREYWKLGRALYQELGLQKKANKFSAWLTEFK